MIDSQNFRFYNFFTSNISALETLQIRVLIMLNVFLMVATIYFLSIALALYQTSDGLQNDLVLLDVTMGMMFLFCFIILRIYKNIQFIILFSSFMFMFFMILFVILSEGQNLGLVRMAFVPVYVIALNGYRFGLKIIFAYYLILFGVIFLNLEAWNLNRELEVGIVRLFVGSFVATGFAFMSEYVVEKIQKALYDLSFTDTLTGVFNRRKIEEALSIELEKQKRKKSEISIVLVDIDNFKKINDTFGHLVGDTVIKDVATLLCNGIRKIDYVGRWGGEEFLLIFPHTSLKNTLIPLEDLRVAISEHIFHDNLKITCSFGVASTNKNNLSQHKLIKLADTALYEAKEQGKNRICSISA